MSIKVGIIGLGYVGLPLAVAFAKRYPVIGFDINENRIDALKLGLDETHEVSIEELFEVLESDDLKNRTNGLLVTDNPDFLGSCTFFIVTVPTPVDKFNRPVLTPLEKASCTVGKYLKHGDIVVYESTVYPGVTEDICIPILEKNSGLQHNYHFFSGYSPERINPGDKERTVTKIKKVTSGSTPKVASYIDEIYASVITAGTFKASSIKVAEAAKVIENAQRDINIAFVNELSKIFNLLKIDTQEVLEAAGTKWNFLPFKPGLVGGHCIGVDPFYLAQKAQEVGYNPEIILAGRRINDSMASHVAAEVVKRMLKKNLPVNSSKALILGITFKENCPDVRNTKVIDIYKELKDYGLEVSVYDPVANPREVAVEFGIEMQDQLDSDSLADFSAIILAVAHQEFASLPITTSASQVVYDVKGVLPKHLTDGRL